MQVLKIVEKVVVDASVVMAVILEEPEKPAIVSVTEGTTLIAPGCLRWEIGNAFSALLKRKRLNMETASRGVDIFEMIPIQEMGVSLEDALELCGRHNLYAYDAYYIQLAKRNSASLLTLDRKMESVAKAENIETKGLI